MKAAALLPRVRALIPAPAPDAELLDRFVQARDHDAFAALVRRHGPLVLATARRVVGNPADADDVFQATFLLLARNAAGIRNRSAIAGWLHGVASRMARTARRTAARRRTHEARALSATPSNHSDLKLREVQQAFEEELAQLPDLYRVPFVACALNGEPRADVARQLQVKEGTISSRLAEAKRRLQERLSARGVSLAAVLGALSLPALGVSADLVSRTMRSVTGPVPAAVSNLLGHGLGIGKKSLVAIVAVVSAGLLVSTLGRAGDAPIGAPPPPAAKSSATEPARPTPATVRGKVLDVDGKPLADVPVRLWSFRNGDSIPEPIARTDAAGTFQFKATEHDFTDDARVVVSPRELPAQWLPLARFTTDQTLQVPKDDVPITGRIASLENQPLKGVTVEIVRVSNIADGSLTAWLDKNAAMRKERYWLNEGGLITLPGAIVAPNTKTTTDADGRFQLTGIGRDRVVTVKTYGPNVETKFFWVVTRTGGPRDGYIHTSDFNHGVYGSDVAVLVGPSRPLVGTVRDSKTGKPVAGVVVSEVNDHIPRSVTDENGRYRLEGVPKKRHYGLNVSGRKGVPYFDHTHTWVADIAGLDPLETDLTIDRGLELKGRVVDSSGRPVRAEVFYHPLDSNPNAKVKIGGVISSDGWKTRPDGTFYLTVWPGRGVLDVRADDGSKYATVDVEKILSQLGVRARPTGSVHALVPIDAVESDAKTLTVTIPVREGAVRKGTVVGPDGKPATGVVAAGVRGGPPAALAGSDFTLAGLNDSSRRLLLFLDEGNKLGAMQVVSGAGTDPIAVKLQPLGSATGTVARPNKEPLGRLTVTALPMVNFPDRYENLPSEVLTNQGLSAIVDAPWWKLTKRIATTDDNGRFELTGLIPGLDYTIFICDGRLEEFNTLVATRRGVKVEAGKANDLGVLKR